MAILNDRLARRGLGQGGRLLIGVPLRSRLRLFAGAFFAFSALGFIVDTLQAVVHHLGFVLVVAAGCGALAVAYTYAMFDRRWVSVAVVAQCVFLAVVIVLRPDGQPLSAATTGAIRTKLIVDGLGCFVAFLASYTAFMSFIGSEGARYMRTHAEIELAGEIHRHLVPAIATKANGFEFHGLSLPSEVVGGDLVDLVRQDRGWIG